MRWNKEEQEDGNEAGREGGLGELRAASWRTRLASLHREMPAKSISKENIAAREEDGTIGFS